MLSGVESWDGQSPCWGSASHEYRRRISTILPASKRSRLLTVRVDAGCRRLKIYVPVKLVWFIHGLVALFFCGGDWTQP